jgi:hypothetical protein
MTGGRATVIDNLTATIRTGHKLADLLGFESRR